MNVIMKIAGEVLGANYQGVALIGRLIRVSFFLSANARKAIAGFPRKPVIHLIDSWNGRVFC